ncbi:hypothetical protein [Alteromonas macleodii]|nr:hypothetical protein [Alteromonas macleodii]OES24134.1 putative membrane protein [Alteromonas macleodii]
MFRKVEPKALRRWYKQGFTLLNQALGFWVLFAIFCTAMASILGHSDLLQQTMIYGCLLCGVGMAKWLEREHRRSITLSIRTYFANLLPALRFSLIAVFIINVASMFIQWLMFPEPDFTKLWYDPDYTFPSLSDGVLQYALHLNNQVVDSVFVFLLVSALPIIAHPFGYGCRELLNVNSREAAKLSIQGTGENAEHVVALAFSFVLLSAVFSLTVPLLNIFVFFPLVSATLWAAWKDVYGFQESNECSVS